MNNDSIATSLSRTSGIGVRYTIVIPAYNEAQRIGPTLDHILFHAAHRSWDIEIVVVDDGSSDATAEVVAGYAARSSFVRLIENPSHRGKGHSVHTGVMNATGDIILITDADLPASLDEAALLLGAIDGGADIAIGSRWLRPDLQQVRQPLQRRRLGRCFNLFVRLLLGLGFADTQCGFKAFSKRAASLTFRFQNVSGWAFDAELLVIAESLGLAVKEVPVRIRHDARSRLKPVLHGLQMLFDVLQIACRRLCGKYPSAAAPALPSHDGGIASRWRPWPLQIPTPARIAFAMLTILATMLMRDIAPVVGSTMPGGDDSTAVWRSAQSNQNSNYALQSAVQDSEQSSLADGSGDAFGD
jgi:hypothetical protein